LFFSLLSFAIYADTADAVSSAPDSIASVDSTKEIVIDTIALQKAVGVASYTSAFTQDAKQKWYDIEQERKAKNDAWIFYILVALLIVLTTLKLAFSNDFNDLFRAFVNSNIASQIGALIQRGYHSVIISDEWNFCGHHISVCEIYLVACFISLSYCRIIFQ
jgi:hypothetical protein